MAVIAGAPAVSGIRERPRDLSRPEVPAIGLLVVTQLVLRVLYAFHHRADSDEPQHLHVAWGWANGFVPYRDQFDNHAPLFHMLVAPWLALTGERPDILPLARLLMIPLVAVTLWATARLGRQLWTRGTGQWAAVLTGLVPTWLLTSSEFRADVLWMALWACALLALLGAPLTPRRAFVGGLLLGATIATSFKTVLLLLALAVAVLVVEVVGGGLRISRRPGAVARPAMALVAGIAVIPAILAAVFWRLHALAALVQCTVRHNIVPGVGLWRSAPHRLLLFPLSLLLLIPIARILLARGRHSATTPARVVLILTAGFYLALLEGYWPLITSQDFLPWIPMAMLAGVAALNGALPVSAHAPPAAIARGRIVALAGIAMLELVAVCRTEAAWHDDSRDQTRLLSDVLRMTRPGEPVMDLKGETVFRPRPCYYVLEGLTKARFANGSLPDPIAADIRRTHTHFVALDHPGFPPQDREFLIRHFIPVGQLRVLGADLVAGAPGAALAFDVCYAERFALLDGDAAARGVLDGTPYRESRLLDTGRHHYRPAPGESHVVAVWEGAVGRGAVMAALPAAR